MCNFQFSSVAQSCPTLCDPMDCSMPGFPVHENSWILLKLMSIKSVKPSNYLILCPLLFSPSISPSIRVFSNESFTSGGTSIGVLASASVLPINIQDWSPLDGLVGSPAVQGTLKSLLQHHSSKASILHCSAFFIVRFSHLLKYNLYKFSSIVLGFFDLPWEMIP